VKLSIDGKVIAKARATSKESRRKASQRTYFALQEKWTKNIIFIKKLHRFRS
jgi:ribonuclease-3